MLFVHIILIFIYPTLYGHLLNLKAGPNPKIKAFLEHHTMVLALEKQLVFSIVVFIIVIIIKLSSSTSSSYDMITINTTLLDLSNINTV